MKSGSAASRPACSSYNPRMLIVTGTIGVDTIHAPTGSAEGVMGGSAAYFAAAASHLAPTRLVGLVGEDWPTEHREVLQSFEGIDFGGVEIRSGGETFKWGGRYFDDMNQRETLFTELGVLEDTPPTVPEEFRDRSVRVPRQQPSRGSSGSARPVSRSSALGVRHDGSLDQHRP